MIDYVVVGAVSCDLLPDGGAVPGGTVRYAAHTALRLGRRPAVVTACHPSFDPQLAPGIALLRLPGTTTATFENRYDPGSGRRTQWLHSPPPPISPAAIPFTWRSAPIVHLAPLAGELQPAAVAAFDSALVAITPQGWLRRTNSCGRIEPATWIPDPALLRRVRAIVLSEEDLAGDEDAARAYAGAGPLVALTRAERGVTLFDAQGGAVDISALPAAPVDPTGAGDVFAAAFLIALDEGEQPAAAARWACAAAACAIEGPGTTCLPDRQMVAARLAGRG